MTGFEFVGPERQTFAGDRWRTVLVNGVQYQVGVVKGKRVRIAYKPRGKNVGFWWHGEVRDSSGGCVWTARVTKSAGVRGILRAAGLID